MCQCCVCMDSSHCQHLVFLDTKLLPWLLSSGKEVVIEQCEENIHGAK